MQLHPIDLAILLAYIGAILGMSYGFARRQRTGEDYFLAGRSMRGGILAMSILANQASAVSLIGAPAFVALREGGGLRWLQYELALPLAMLLLIAVLLPTLRSVPASSIYAYGEQRFGRLTRRALALSFVLSRGLALGVVLYASALVVATALGWPVLHAIVILGGLSVAYTSLGGIVADIWSDALQLVLLWVGTLLAGVYIVQQEGLDVIRAIPPERTSALVMTGWGVGEGSEFAFWPMLLGGVFLYLSYYGCDQSQAQRLLTARDDGAARRALVLNGLLRFPLVLTYCGFGLLLAGLLRTDTAFAASMSSQPPDSLVPTFVVGYLPAGLRGLFLAGILAAAMSSIDSAMNSLAAVTLEDICDRPPEAQPVWLSRSVSLGWGLFAVASGAAFAATGAGVLEAINQVGSAFYGPVLAVFVLGVVAPRVTEGPALGGLAAGLLGNLALGWWAPNVSWLWWNPAGFLVAMGTALIASRGSIVWPTLTLPRREATLLVVGFVVMLLVLLWLPHA